MKLAVSVAATIAAALHGQAYYEVRSLGFLPNTSASIAMGINNNGMIAGFSMGSSFDDAHAFSFNGTTCALTDLGSLGGRMSASMAMSEGGDSFGMSKNNEGVMRAFTYSKGVMKDLGGTTGVEYRALAANAYGTAVGMETLSGGESAVKFKYGQRLFFPKYEGGIVNQATAVNDYDRVVGFRAVGGEFWGLVHFPEQISTPPNYGWARIKPLARNPRVPGLEMGMRPAAINENGMVAGSAGLTKTHAFRFNSNTFEDAVDLGSLNPGDPSALSVGTAINNSNWVVGWSETTVPNQISAFLHNGVKMIDLHSTLVNGAGWRLLAANGINDRGEIVGTGTFNGQQHAFVLLPRPTPHTFPGQPGNCSPGNQLP